MIGENNENNRADCLEEKNDEEKIIGKALNDSNTSKKQEGSQKHSMPCIQRFFCCGCNNDSVEDLSDKPSLTSAMKQSDNVTDIEAACNQNEEESQELPECLPKWMHVRFVTMQIASRLFSCLNLHSCTYLKVAFFEFS